RSLAMPFPVFRHDVLFPPAPPLVVTASEVQVAWDGESCISDPTQSQHAPHDSDTEPAMTTEHDAARGASSHHRLMRMMIDAGFSQGRVLSRPTASPCHRRG